VGDGTYPDIESLSASLALKDGGGIVAALAPYGLSVNDHAVFINRAFVKALFADAVPTLGDALRSALQAHLDQHGTTLDYMRRIYRIQGDTGLKVHLPIK
jgi:hypothetical protein